MNKKEHGATQAQNETLSKGKQPEEHQLPSEIQIDSDRQIIDILQMMVFMALTWSVFEGLSLHYQGFERSPLVVSAIVIMCGFIF